MLIGHYAVALAAKRSEPRTSLGLLFLAVQFADLLFFPLVVIGIESAQIIPDLTEASHFKLESAPFTHGLLGSTLVALAVYLGFKLLARRSGVETRVPLVMGAAVLSHWALDVIVHTPDMAFVTGGDPVIGFGLWESAAGTYFLEGVMVLGGLWLYLQATAGTSRLARYGMVGFVVFMLLFNVYNLFQPAPDADASVGALAIPAVAGYLAFAGIAMWLDRRRAPRMTVDEVFAARADVAPMSAR